MDILDELLDRLIKDLSFRSCECAMVFCKCGDPLGTFILFQFAIMRCSSATFPRTPPLAAAGNGNWRNVPIPAVLQIASYKHHIAGIMSGRDKLKLRRDG